MTLRNNIVIGGVLLTLFLVLPLAVSSRYVLSQVILFFIWYSVVTQWNLIFGVAGIFSLAQMMVFAFGGYTTAMLSFHFDWSIWLTGPIGGVIAVIASGLIGVATLRLRGAYVAVLTLAMASAMQAVIIADTNCLVFEAGRCITLTGGSSGLSRFGDFGFRDLLGYRRAILGEYYVGLALVVAGSVFAFATINSPLGHAFRALRDNPRCAAVRGIDRIKYQVMVFSLSGFFTGLTGGFYAAHFDAIGPNILSFTTLLFLLTSMIVGGAGRFWGPFLGVAVMMVFNETLMGLEEWRSIGLGVFTIVAIIVFPEGLSGFLDKQVPGRIGSFAVGLPRLVRRYIEKATDSA